MTYVAWIAVAGLLVTILLNIAGHLVAWGALKSVVQSLDRRVVALEKEIALVSDIRVDIGVVKTKIDGIEGVLKEIKQEVVRPQRTRRLAQ